MRTHDLHTDPHVCSDGCVGLAINLQSPARTTPMATQLLNEMTSTPYTRPPHPQLLRPTYALMDVLLGIMD